MLNEIILDSKTVAPYFEGFCLNLKTDPIARALALFEKERQARLDRKPFHFYSSLYAAAECLVASLPHYGGIYSLQWKKTNAGFMWPVIDGMQLIMGEVFALKLAIVDSIWALNPPVFCDADFSLWLNDTSFSDDFESKAVQQVNWMLVEADDEILNRSGNGKDILSILKALKYESLTRASLMKSTGFNRTFLDTHAIKPALKAGLIERTEKKPSSPKQEYKITSIGLKVLSNRTCI